MTKKRHALIILFTVILFVAAALTATGIGLFAPRKLASYLPNSEIVSVRVLDCAIFQGTEDAEEIPLNVSEEVFLTVLKHTSYKIQRFGTRKATTPYTIELHYQDGKIARIGGYKMEIYDGVGVCLKGRFIVLDRTKIEACFAGISGI